MVDPAEGVAPPPAAPASPASTALPSPTTGAGASAAALSRPPVRVQIVGDEGYVWDADDARFLREHRRLVGAMVGGVAGYKQQNAFSGLPLKLVAEEVAFAVGRGWVAPYWVVCDPDADDPCCVRGEGEGEEEGGAGGGAADGDGDEPATISANDWRAGLQKGRAFAVPLTSPVTATSPSPPDGGDATPWATAANAGSRAVFADLNARGYHLTPGGNFGADWLAYPADPVLYHAQLCVRNCDGEAPLCPVLLAAATRGAHAARKHLLLATPGAGGVAYLTIAPEVGFGG